MKPAGGGRRKRGGLCHGMSLYVGPGSKFHGATFSGGVPLMLKRCVLLKRGRNRPAPDLASRQDVCYEVAGQLAASIPATPSSFRWEGPTLAKVRESQDARRAIIAASQ